MMFLDDQDYEPRIHGLVTGTEIVANLVLLGGVGSFIVWVFFN